MLTSPLDGVGGRREALEDGLAFLQLLLDLAGVGGGFVRSDGAIALAATAAQAVAHPLALAVAHAEAVQVVAELVHSVARHAVLGVLKLGHRAIE